MARTERVQKYILTAEWLVMLVMHVMHVIQGQ